MAAVNPAATGGPVGGGNAMMMMGGVDANMPAIAGSEETKVRLNTYIYEYVLKLGLHDAARALNSQQDKFKIDSKPKQSPGRRKDGEANGVDSDAMDVDKFDIPNDLPLPNIDMSPQGEGFLIEWFSIFSDLFAASSKSKQGVNNPATQYLMTAQVSEPTPQSVLSDVRCLEHAQNERRSTKSRSHATGNDEQSVCHASEYESQRYGQRRHAKCRDGQTNVSHTYRDGAIKSS